MHASVCVHTTEEGVESESDIIVDNTTVKDTPTNANVLLHCFRAKVATFVTTTPPQEGMIRKQTNHTQLPADLFLALTHLVPLVMRLSMGYGVMVWCMWDLPVG